MKNEIEIKFKISNPHKIRMLFKDNGGVFIGKAFEKTIHFDMLNKDLEKTGRFL